MWSQQHSINPLLPARYRILKEESPIHNCGQNLRQTRQSGLKSRQFFNPRDALVWSKVKTLRRKTSGQLVKALRRGCREEVCNRCSKESWQGLFLQVEQPRHSYAESLGKCD